MLLNNFFTVEQMSGDVASGTITININGQHEVFAGHFPGKPVVPGVFSLQMIKECMNLLLNKKLQYTELLNCKFSNMILPEVTPTLRLDYQIESGDKTRLNATIKFDSTTFLILKAILTEGLISEE